MTWPLVMRLLTLLLLLLAGRISNAAGIDNGLITSMLHAGWSAHEGAPQGAKAIDQATDGRLLIAAAGGLYACAGRAFSPFVGPAGQPSLPASEVQSLLVSRDGAIWVAFLPG